MSKENVDIYNLVVTNNVINFDNYCLFNIISSEANFNCCDAENKYTFPKVMLNALLLGEGYI